MTATIMDVKPVILDGIRVRLEPLTLDHVAPLCKVGLDPEIWAITMAMVRSEEDMRRYVESALQLQERGTALPFATVDKVSGRVAGSTRFGNIDKSNRRVEIGWTWLGKEFQRSYVNTEAKYLMLKHAFGVWGSHRVEFKTDALNEKSRSALTRIGAKQEGIMRRHQITETGRVRDSVYFSIIDEEWPDVRARLEGRITV